MNYLTNFLTVIPFLLLLFYNIKKLGRVIALSNFIIALYTFSMLSYGITCFNNPTYYLTIKAYLIVFFSILILTYPISAFEKKFNSDTTIAELNTKKFRIILIILLILNIIAIGFFSTNLVKLFNSDFTSIRNEIMSGKGFYESSIFSKIAVFGAYLSPISLFLYFYTLIINQFKIIRNLLFIGSTSFILYSANVAGRDGLIIWFISFIALICLFYPVLSKEIRAKQRKVIIIAVSLALPYFTLMTIGRFAEDNKVDKDAIFSVFDYIGQQPYQLSDLIDKKEYLGYEGQPRMIYPIFVNIENFVLDRKDPSENLGRMELREISIDYGYQTWCFPYYMGSIIVDLGYTGFIIFSLILYFIFITNLRVVDNYLSITNLLIGFSWSMIIIVGVFFFYYGQSVGNVYLLIPFFIHFFLKYELE